MIARVPAPFRIGYSTLGGPDVLTKESHPDADTCIRKAILPDHFHPDQLREDDPAVTKKWRKRLTDVQHLSAHLLARRDIFVTSDEDDMWRKRGALLTCGVVIMNPPEAVALVSTKVGDQRATPHD